MRSSRWARQPPGPFGPEGLDPESYADSLCEYAAGRLDPRGLRAWVVWRLIADGALDHDDAEVVAAAAIARGHAGGPRREPHDRHRLHRPHPPSRPGRPAA
ncbi:MAG TPA: hypothetical protein VHC45_04495 [Gaiellaceae bacterium]|nr:hypothetical protein [Gaiellaceae bacterium]